MNRVCFLPIKLLLLLALSVLAISVYGQLSPLRIGFYPHYQIDKYKELIRASYARLGIEVQFIAIPSGHRSLMELEKGSIDAELMRTRLTATEYDGALLIGPSLATAHVMLLCRSPLPCSEDVLKDPNSHIITTNAQLKLWPSDPDKAVHASVVSMENVKSVYAMFSEGRSDYAIVSVDGTTPPPMDVDFHHISLHQVALYHVLSNRYQQLEEPLSKAIEQELAQFAR